MLYQVESYFADKPILYWNILLYVKALGPKMFSFQLPKSAFIKCFVCLNSRLSYERLYVHVNADGARTLLYTHFLIYILPFLQNLYEYHGTIWYLLFLFSYSFPHFFLLFLILSLLFTYLFIYSFRGLWIYSYNSIYYSWFIYSFLLLLLKKKMRKEIKKKRKK